jgi:hypothetical protein
MGPTEHTLGIIILSYRAVLNLILTMGHILQVKNMMCH